MSYFSSSVKQNDLTTVDRIAKFERKHIVINKKYMYPWNDTYDLDAFYKRLVTELKYETYTNDSHMKLIQRAVKEIWRRISERCWNTAEQSRSVQSTKTR